MKERKLFQVGDVKPYIAMVQKLYDTNQSIQKTADLLGVSRTTLLNLMRRHSLTNKQAAAMEKSYGNLGTKVVIQYERRVG